MISPNRILDAAVDGPAVRCGRAARTRLWGPDRGAWLGLAWIDASTRILDEGDATRVSLRDVVNLHLGPPIVGPLRIAVRPQP